MRRELCAGINQEHEQRIQVPLDLPGYGLKQQKHPPSSALGREKCCENIGGKTRNTGTFSSTERVLSAFLELISPCFRSSETFPALWNIQTSLSQSQSCSWLSWTRSAASAVLQLLPWVYPPSKRLARPLISFLELMRSGREPGRAGPAPQGAAPSLFCWKSGRCPEFQAGIRAWLPGLAPRWHSWSAQGTGASSISSPGCFHVDLGSSPVWE